MLRAQPLPLGRTLFVFSLTHVFFRADTENTEVAQRRSYSCLLTGSQPAMYTAKTSSVLVYPKVMPDSRKNPPCPLPMMFLLAMDTLTIKIPPAMSKGGSTCSSSACRV